MCQNISNEKDVDIWLMSRCNHLDSCNVSALPNYFILHSTLQVTIMTYGIIWHNGKHCLCHRLQAPCQSWSNTLNTFLVICYVALVICGLNLSYVSFDTIEKCSGYSSSQAPKFSALPTYIKIMLKKFILIYYICMLPKLDINIIRRNEKYFGWLSL